MAFDSVSALRMLTADTIVLQMKAQNYHWNLVGGDFFELHQLFEVQYSELFEAVDEIAEQLRMMRATPPSTLAEVLTLTRMKEGHARTRDAMLADMRAGHEQMSANLRKAFSQLSNDPSTQELLVRRLQAHDKAAWMLRASESERAEPPAKIAKPAKPPKAAPKAKPLVKASSQKPSATKPKKVGKKPAVEAKIVAPEPVKPKPTKLIVAKKVKKPKAKAVKPAPAKAVPQAKPVVATKKVRKAIG